jgi:hypothetical protein
MQQQTTTITLSLGTEWKSHLLPVTLSLIQADRGKGGKKYGQQRTTANFNFNYIILLFSDYKSSLYSTVYHQ